jgi:hypothetical protein
MQRGISIFILNLKTLTTLVHEVLDQLRRHLVSTDSMMQRKAAIVIFLQVGLVAFISEKSDCLPRPWRPDQVGHDHDRPVHRNPPVRILHQHGLRALVHEALERLHTCPLGSPM